VTHLYHPGPGAVVDRHGVVRPEYRDARERGVLMETGFARWHTDFEIMRKAFDRGFWPDIIGTDVTTTNIDDLVYDLLYTAGKFLALGMPLEDVLTAMTLAPARAMSRTELAQVREGGAADLSVLEVREEETRFRDYYGHTMDGNLRIVCRHLVSRGSLIPPGR